MSETNNSRAWVSDLDDYVSYHDIDDEMEAKQGLQKLGHYEIGDLELLAGRAISARLLYEKGISPSEWRHALHLSKMAIGFGSNTLIQHEEESTGSHVSRFVKAMIDLGRPYAIARYARWERLDYPSAITATLPHGIRALVNQLLASEGIPRSRDVDASIQAVLGPSGMSGVIAYRRTGLLQATLHQIAEHTTTHPGGTKLNRKRMRAMLALTRLYFSTIELRLASIEELRSLLFIYEEEREIARRDEAQITTNGRLIRAWRLRHVQPLVNLFPYSIRHGLKRALAHGEADFDRIALVNELALAHCGIFRMRAAGRARMFAK